MRCWDNKPDWIDTWSCVRDQVVCDAYYQARKQISDVVWGSAVVLIWNRINACVWEAVGEKISEQVIEQESNECGNHLLRILRNWVRTHE